MKYKEWIGDLEGSLPDVGLVHKGRVLLIDTDGKAEALKGHEKSLQNLTLEEGEARWQKQLKADAKAATGQEAEPAQAPEPAAPASTDPTPTPDALPDTTADKATPKGGKK